MTTNSEAVQWNNTGQGLTRGRKPSRSVLAVKELAVGDTVRIRHPEVRCTIGTPVAHQQCTLVMSVYQLQKHTGMRFEYYHEESHVLVIRRLA